MTEVMVGNTDYGRRSNNGNSHDCPRSAKPGSIDYGHQGGNQGGDPATDETRHTDDNGAAVKDKARGNNERIHHADNGNRTPKKTGDRSAAARPMFPSTNDETIENAQ